MTDEPERVPLKARVKMTYGIDADDPTPNQVTTFYDQYSGLIAHCTATVTVMRTDEFVRLDLGAGKIVRRGFTPIGRDYGTEVYPLAYRSNWVDEIVASHVLEHFPHAQVQAVLNDWVRALKPGGRIRIAVPDFRLINAEYFSEPGRFALVQRWIMGGQTDANDYHKTIFDHDSLRRLMVNAGLRVLGRWESEIVDCARDPISLNLEGQKP